MKSYRKLTRRRVRGDSLHFGTFDVQDVRHLHGRVSSGARPANDPHAADLWSPDVRDIVKNVAMTGRDFNWAGAAKRGPRPRSACIAAFDQRPWHLSCSCELFACNLDWTLGAASTHHSWPKEALC